MFTRKFNEKNVRKKARFEFPTFCLASISLDCEYTNSFYLLDILKSYAKLYIPNTLNIDLILWHTQLIVCAENVKSWLKSWVIYFIFQAHNLPHALYCIYVSLSEFHI